MSSADIHFMFSSLCWSCWFTLFFRDPFLIWSLFLVNIIWAFLTPTCKKATTTCCSTLPPSFKDGFVRRWNHNIIQYLRKTFQFKKVLKRGFFFFKHHIIFAKNLLQLYLGPNISTMTSWQVCRRACRHPQPSTVSYFANYTILNNFHGSSRSLCCRWQSLRSVCVQTFFPQMNERTWNTFRSEPVQPASPRPDSQTAERYDAVCFSYWSFSYRNRNVMHDNEMKGIVGAVVIMRIGGYGAVWVSLQHRESEGGLAGGNCFLLNTEYIFVSEEKKCFPLWARRLNCSAKWKCEHL